MTDDVETPNLLLESKSNYSRNKPVVLKYGKSWKFKFVIQYKQAS